MIIEDFIIMRLTIILIIIIIIKTMLIAIIIIIPRIMIVIHIFDVMVSGIILTFLVLFKYKLKKIIKNDNNNNTITLHSIT